MVKTQRCSWCGTDDLYRRYHDKEWGIPLYNANELFELLVLEGMQAGLSWITILRKRKRFRELMMNLEPEKLAKTDIGFIDSLMQEPGIIRHRGKLEACVQNAQSFLRLQGKLDIVDYLWSFTGPAPKLNSWGILSEIPASTDESRQMATSLKREGFKFVGPTICYAFMQSAGMVNDHVVTCFRYKACAAKDAVRSLVE